MAGSSRRKRSSKDITKPHEIPTGCLPAAMRIFISSGTAHASISHRFLDKTIEHRSLRGSRRRMGAIFYRPMHIRGRGACLRENELVALAATSLLGPLVLAGLCSDVYVRSDANKSRIHTDRSAGRLPMTSAADPWG